MPAGSNVRWPDVERKLKRLGCRIRSTRHGYKFIRRMVDRRWRCFTLPLIRGRQLKASYLKRFCRHLEISDKEWKDAQTSTSAGVSFISRRKLEDSLA